MIPLQICVDNLSHAHNRNMKAIENIVDATQHQKRSFSVTSNE